MRAPAERAKEARLAQIERQRKAYGLLPKGTALGAREEEAASDRPLSLAEQQDAEAQFGELREGRIFGSYCGGAELETKLTTLASLVDYDAGRVL